MRASLAALGLIAVLAAACDGAPSSETPPPDTAASSPVVDAAPPADTVPAPEPNPDACGASGFQTWVGQPRSSVPAAPAGADWRIYETGDALIQNFSTERLNVEIDPATDQVVRVWCG